MILNKIPDFNFNRAKNPDPRKRNFIFSTPTTNYKSEFPIYVISSAVNSPQFVYDNDENTDVGYSADIKLSIYTKKDVTFLCDDGVKRKNDAFLEYIMNNHLLKQLTKNRYDLLSKFTFLETYTFSTGFEKEYNESDWLLGLSITLKSYYRTEYTLASNVEAIIEEINLNYSIDE
jgi:hypothetical protein